MSEPEEDPFSDYTEQLKSAVAERRGRFRPWQRDLLVFRRLTDEVLWEGLPGALANMWRERDELISGLRRMGAADHADRIAIALDRASFSGLASGGRLDVGAVNASPVSQVFEGAEAAFNADWENLWRLAEAYARARGWAGERDLD